MKLEWKHENIDLDTKVMRGTVYSDHYLVTKRICPKLARAEGRKNVREMFDLSKLPSEEIRRKYNTEVRNRFGALGDIGRTRYDFGNIQRWSKESLGEVKGT